jgi:filamentous hemagglutinin
MTKADHAQTASHSSQGAAGAVYRKQQAALIDQGKFRDAVQMDINDIRKKFGGKYDAHIQEMLDYYKTVPEWKLQFE